MRLVRVAIVNVNSTIGAIQSNVNRAVALARAVSDLHVHLAVFPEQMIGGYPAEDLVQWPAFLDAQLEGLSSFAKQTSHLPALFAVGFLLNQDGHIYNCAALVYQGIIFGICPKEKLPTYNVFYEGRTLSQGIPFQYEELDLLTKRGTKLLGPDEGKIPFGDLMFQCGFGKMALEVCEDIWSPEGPMRRRCFAGAELVANLSASPFRLGITDTRRELINTRSSDNQVTVVYANAVGANDGLVFDGGGYISQNGRMILSATRFREGYEVGCVDLDRTLRMRMENSTFRNEAEQFAAQGRRARLIKVPSRVPKEQVTEYPLPASKSFFIPKALEASSARKQFCEDILNVISLGIGDYFEKTGAFRCIGVALSGGRDSLLCLLAAHRYSRKQPQPNPPLFAFFMPSRYSSAHSKKIATQAAESLGIPLTMISIDEAFTMEQKAAGHMLGGEQHLNPITLQNIQARIRGERMWNWANSAGGLVLQTSNMSEKAVGYTTIGGDMMGGFSPIANLPKTLVNYLLTYLSEQPGLAFIQEVLSKPVSAELSEGQESEKDLMPFSILDSCIALMLGEKMSTDEVKGILTAMFPEYTKPQIHGWVEKFVKLWTQSIYKWVQSPLGVHLGNIDLDRERAFQLPVVFKTEWSQTK